MSCKKNLKKWISIDKHFTQMLSAFLQHRWPAEMLALKTKSLKLSRTISSGKTDYSTKPLLKAYELKQTSPFEILNHLAQVTDQQDFGS